MTKADWLADVLRAGGCTVIERPGWKDRGRGNLGPVRGVLCHHTGPGSRDGLLALIENGRSDLPGPLSQLFLDVDGTFYVVAARRCNHAGRGRWQGVEAGNSELVGIEARNAGDGRDPWPVRQMDAYERGVAAILSHIGADDVMVAGHKEFALPRGRKIDPTFDMFEFRRDVGAIMAGRHPAARPVPLVDPVRSMLRKGDHGNSVRELQVLLGVEADGFFGPQTERTVIAFQARSGLEADGFVGPKTWAALSKS